MIYNTADPAMPPSTCAMTYAGSSEIENRLATTNPTDTAGFKWHPEMWPIANAMVSTVRPNARATPAKPIPRPGKAAASTALPHPPKTSQKVPINSANALFDSGIQRVLSFGVNDTCAEYHDLSKFNMTNPRNPRQPFGAFPLNRSM